ncbi:MAG: [FeFe] hydrogenase, group A [Bacteroidales bacterium]|jgi:ferredoxin hydrogenase|nr:[FeFe] hydrogenase, group A [Bacteroidales bacterium]
MSKINRREFIEKVLLFNGSVFLGAGFIEPWMYEFFQQSAVDYYVAIQENNPSILRFEKKCKGCRDCIDACRDKQLVFGTYKQTKTHHVCIHCGTCIMACDRGALVEKYHWQNVLDAIDDPSKIVIASVSPSVPAGIGDHYGFPSGSYLPENIIGACRAIGFDYVLDTNFSADLTIMEEAKELQHRIKGKGMMPQFTSCCPAWVKYVEIFYPSLLPHLSTTRSPIIMQGSMVKTYFAGKKGLDPANIVHVAITPCTAKKYEITRPELTVDGMPSTDISITTNELAMMLKSRKVDLVDKKSSYDSLMGIASGGGALFGNTGGVMQAALRTAYYNMTRRNPPAGLVDLKEVKGLNGFKEASLTIGKKKLNVAVCYEMRNAKIVLDQVMNGSCKYDFIEVMACQGGCVGGAGQPPKTIADLENRIKALENADVHAATRFCHENPEIKAIYKNFLGRVGGPKAHKYLHTAYNDKSALLIASTQEKVPEKVLEMAH